MAQQRIIISGIQKSRRGSRRYTYLFHTSIPETVIEYVEIRWPLGHGNVTYIDGFTDENGKPLPDSKWNCDKVFHLTMFDELLMISIIGKKKKNKKK